MATSGGGEVKLQPLPALKPELYQRAWASIPHPTLPLLATCHSKAVTVYSLSTLSSHSTLTGGHARSVRSAAWKPAQPPHKLCLATGSFDSTAALWRWDGDNVPFTSGEPAPAQKATGANLEVEITAASIPASGNTTNGDDATSEKDEDWEFSLVLEGHESEVKSVAFSPSAQYLATCSRDKTVWIWEDVGADEADDEWETVAVLNEHEADVKCVAWCPDVPGRTAKGKYGAEVLASSSYDNTVRIWREDGDGEWVCVAVLEGHEGTVWGVQWESDTERTKFPRLMSFSADKTIRIWTLREDDEEEEGGDGRNPLFRPGLGGIPNTMRQSVREEWECTVVLPAVHTRDVYSAAWSVTTGLIASTGSDGIIAVYKEDPLPANGDIKAATAGTEATEGTPNDNPGPGRWRVLYTLKNAHGPYEINHITWCHRFDSETENRGIEEMLVTTGDNGVIKPWRVITS
ncbi:putative cytosolic iron-sulfur protein assembly protein 1 [Cytospora mali]|uniref:Probable cytosolic iron-sulfur protein assembly protein 1 n=1 Tax=Cytospora mali TaxID=578113 RepID=A0A194V7P1_CYTMA|nr:putative cytosolic iron-sulfur protein assembly protein 1 [Valsa mali var. pyri (nom. inval.)]